jgi:signal transduction histidine kinase
MQILQSRIQKLTGHREEIATELITLVDRMTATIQDLLAYARPASPTMASISLLRELRSCLGVLSADAVMQGVQTELDMDENLTLLGDWRQLRQVFINTFLNAAQAMNGIGRIRVDATTEDDHVVISIADTGPGIDPAVLPHIFEPFFTTKTHGTGLGLAITQRIVREHGGTITVENLPEGGACFRLTLPLPPER